MDLRLYGAQYPFLWCTIQFYGDVECKTVIYNPFYNTLFLNQYFSLPLVAHYKESMRTLTDKVHGIPP